MPSFFITGTDTNVGKTIATGLIAKECLDLGLTTVTQKWIQSGSNESLSDIDTHLSIMGLNKNDYKLYLKSMSPYSFKLAASAHLAAEEENKAINPDYLFACSTALSKVFDVLLIEGSGGLQVPINDDLTLCDLLELCKYPTFVVISNKLGAINHSLLTLEALHNRKIPVAGLIMNELTPHENPKILADNRRIIEQLSHCKIVASIPYGTPYKLENKEELITVIQNYVQNLDSSTAKRTVSIKF
jgi:dethiobiotin synthetase